MKQFQHGTHSGQPCFILIVVVVTKNGARLQQVKPQDLFDTHQHHLAIAYECSAIPRERIQAESKRRQIQGTTAAESCCSELCKCVRPDSDSIKF